MSFDVDDVGAVCLAHALADRGEAHLIAMLHNSGYPEGVGALSVINEYYGRNVVLGAFKGTFGRQPPPKGGGEADWVRGPFIQDLIRNWQPEVSQASQVSDALHVYRRALVGAADHSVVIAAIGFATNLAALLQSQPDHISPLHGTDLVQRKVRRVVWQG